MKPQHRTIPCSLSLLLVLLPCIFFLLFVDASVEEWTSKAPLPNDLRTLGLGVAAFEIFVFGGHSPSNNFETKVFKYDTLADVWTSCQQLPGPRKGPEAGAHNGEIFLTGGAYEPSFNAVSDVFKYTVSSDAYTSASPMPTKRRNHAQACVNSLAQCFVVGGQTGYPFTTTTSSHEKYDITSDVWATVTAHPHPTATVAAVVGTKFFVIAGVSDTTPLLSAVHAYVTTSDFWTTVASCPVARQITAAVAHGQYAIALGGREGLTGTIPGLSTVHSYSVTDDEWTTLPPLPTPRYFDRCGLLQDTMYSVGGPVSNIDTAGGTNVYAYTFPSASVVGDPLFTAFDGTAYHLALRSGLFNFLSSPTMVVNGLVEHFPYLPPEEDTVVTMIGVVGVFKDCPLQVWVSAATPDKPSCRYRTCPQMTQKALGSILDEFCSVHLSDFSVQFDYKHTHYAPLGVNATYINLQVLSHRGHPTVWGGILADLTTGNVSAVQQNLVDDYYEVAGGDLFSLDAQSSISIFEHHRRL